jgi:hypothetical protein
MMMMMTYRMMMMSMIVMRRRLLLVNHGVQYVSLLGMSDTESSVDDYDDDDDDDDNDVYFHITVFLLFLVCLFVFICYKQLNAVLTTSLA